MKRVAHFALIFLAIIIFMLFIISNFFEDYLWYQDLGYSQLFWTPLLAKVVLQFINGLILFIFIASTLFSIRHAILTIVNERLRKRLRLVHEMDRPLYYLSQRKMTIWLFGISALISFGFSFITGFTGWLDVLTFINSTPFEMKDPVFERDLSFYIFKLPFFYTIFNAFFGPLFLLTFFTALFYIFTGVISFRSFAIWRKNALVISPPARRHLAVLITVLFAFKAFGYYFDTFRLLYSQQGLVLGAGYADIHATLPALKLLIFLSILGFGGGLLSIFKNEIRLFTLPIIILLVCSPLLTILWPSFLQSMVVIPNELEKEAPYLENEINLTRYAYGLDKVIEKEYPANGALSAAALQKELPVLKNIPLYDYNTILQTYSQKQGVVQYYKFPDIDVDRYIINGEYRQVLLSPRELSSQDLEESAQTYVNLRFKYTHGYGVVSSFTSSYTAEGLPIFALKDIPPVTEYQEFLLTQPRIYFGELTDDWVVVNTQLKEFDYPTGRSDVEFSYKGNSGIRLTPLNRFMLSLKHGTLRFYLVNEINHQSRILLHRNIMERVEKLVPFLEYDKDPYIVLDEGRLKWIIDAYSVSNTFPYSSMYSEQEINYIRNSVKVVVDAYDGSVDFYIADPEDPILQTYTKIFPGVFKDIKEMSPKLREHLRYPKTLFTIQSNLLKNFHTMDLSVYYNKEDAWDIAKALTNSEPKSMKPYYTVLQLPGESAPEMVLMVPFTPASSTNNLRSNMVAWLAARMDGEHYGELILFKLPKNLEVYGPLQIDSRIDQDPKIAEQLSLWNQKGSTVIRGNLSILPVGGNFLYIEPIYLQSEKSGSIPEMKRVIVAYEDKIVMSETLEDAFSELFGVKLKLSSPPMPNLSGYNPLMSIEEDRESQDYSLDDIQSLVNQIEQIREMLDELEAQLLKITGDSLDTE